MSQLQLLGLILVPASLIGVVCNGLIVYVTWKCRSASHSFSLLTGNQALFNGLHSTLFFLYVMPMYVLDSDLLKNNSHRIGFILLICYDVSMYAHFIITINRFCAVFLPITYRTMFDTRMTTMFIAFFFILSTSVFIVFFQILPCQCAYNPERWTFTYTYSSLCMSFGWFDACKLLSFTIFNVVVDMITITKVRRTRNLIRKGQPANAAVKKKEIDFLKQSFSQSLFLFVIMPSFYITPMFTSSKSVGFIVGNVSWCLMHSLDGALTLYFNSEVRKGLWKRKNNGVLAVTSVDGKSKSTM